MNELTDYQRGSRDGQAMNEMMRQQAEHGEKKLRADLDRAKAASREKEQELGIVRRDLADALDSLRAIRQHTRIALTRPAAEELPAPTLKELDNG